MALFNLVTIAAFLRISSVIAQSNDDTFTKTQVRRLIKRKVEAVEVAFNERITEMENRMTTLMDGIQNVQSDNTNDITNLGITLFQTSNTCCPSSVPSNVPSFVPSDSPSTSPTDGPSSNPTISLSPTQTCADEPINIIDGVFTPITGLVIDGKDMLVTNKNSNVVQLWTQDDASKWSFMQNIEPGISIYSSSDFGSGLAIDDQHYVVTSTGYYSSDTGRLFIYERTGETPDVFENPGSGKGSDFFGSSVALSGDTIVVGAKDDDTQGTNAGMAHIYKRNGGVWEFAQTFGHPEPSAVNSYDNFGKSVAADGDTVIVGAIGAGTAKAGCVFIYSTSSGTGTYSFIVKLEPDGGVSSDYFGSSVAMSEGIIAVGAPYIDSPQYNAGAVYFYRYDGTFIKKIEGTGSNSKYGYTVAMDGNKIAVSSYDNFVDVFTVLPSKEIVKSGTMTSDEPYFGDMVTLSGATVASVGGNTYGSGQKVYQQTIC